MDNTAEVTPMRLSAAVLAAVFTLGTAYSGEPKPLWEIDAAAPATNPTQPVPNYGMPVYSSPQRIPATTPAAPNPKTPPRTIGPGWLSFSPDGRSLAAVVVSETRGSLTEYTYQLRVWNGADRKERFSATLGGVGRTEHLGDDLASFPSNESILTGGTEVVVRNLLSGQVESSQNTGGLPAHTVWSVPDLRETFYLCRDKLRFEEPVELTFQSNDLSRDQFQQFPGRRFRYNEPMTEQASLRPTRDGLRTESVAMNFARTRMAVAFHDDPAAATPRHSLALYHIKTADEFELVPVAEAVNPPGGPVSALAFARNGRTLASGAEDGSVYLWDVDDDASLWKPRAAVEGVCTSRVVALTFSRDWRMVAAVTWDKTKPNLLLMDADAGKLLGAVRLPGELRTVTFSPDCRTVLTGSGDGKIRAWDIAALLKGEPVTGQAKQTPAK